MTQELQADEVAALQVKRDRLDAIYRAYINDRSSAATSVIEAAILGIAIHEAALRAQGDSASTPLRAKAQEVVAGHVGKDGTCRECAMTWPCHAWLLADEILRQRDSATTEGAVLDVRTLVSLVRSGFLVTVNGKRVTPDYIRGEPYHTMLMAILQAEDTDAALRALLADVPDETVSDPCMEPGCSFLGGSHTGDHFNEFTTRTWPRAASGTGAGESQS